MSLQSSSFCRSSSVFRRLVLLCGWLAVLFSHTGAASAQGLTLTIRSAYNSEVGQDYYQWSEVSGAQSNYAYNNFTFAVVAGSLPSGTSLDWTGTVSGRLTAAGPFSYTLQVADSSPTPRTATQTVSGTIAGPAQLNLVSYRPSGMVGQNYYQSNSATGGIAPYNFTITSGTVPAGTAIDAVYGHVTGLASVAESYRYTVTVTDSDSPPQTDSQAVTATIRPPSPLTVYSNLATETQVGRYFWQRFDCNGGVLPCGFAVSAGALPDGVTLDAYGTLTGVPRTAGGFSFTMTATDSGGAYRQSASVAISGVMLPLTGLVLNSSRPVTTRIDEYYWQNNVTTGGFLPYTFVVSAGSIPAGTYLDPGYGYVGGWPTTAGPFSYTIKVIDDATPPQTVSRTISGTIYGVQLATTTTLSSSPNPSLMGQLVVLSDRVEPVSSANKMASTKGAGAAASTVSGTVQFMDGSEILCAEAPIVSGVARCAATFRTASSHAISAIYSGSNEHFGSTSATLVQTVNDQRGKTVETIGNFMGRRNDAIMSNQTDGSRQIDRLVEAGGGGAQSSSSTAQSQPANGGWQTASQLGGRLGDGPDAGDLARLRFGQERTFNLSDVNSAANDGGTGVSGPFKANGNTDGLMRFGFSTSLRDIARYAADTEARKTQEAGFSLNAGGDAKRVARPNPFDIWIEGKFSSFRDTRAASNLDGYFGLMTAGADYVLNRSLLFGAMVQYDSMRQVSKRQATEVAGRGWMTGPYATVRVTDNLFWQSRFAWGQSSNDIRPFMSYSDTFQTTRWLSSSTLAGRWEYGNLAFRPSASVSYMEDVSKGYADKFGVMIPVVRSSLGQAKVGPEVSYRFEPNGNIVLEPHAGMQVIWNFAGTTTADGFGVVSGDSAGPLGVRGRAEIGLRATRVGGLGLDIAGSYDGIGLAGYSAFTGKATMHMPLN
jgi:hypothetical protein